MSVSRARSFKDRAHTKGPHTQGSPPSLTKKGSLMKKRFRINLSYKKTTERIHWKLSILCVVVAVALAILTSLLASLSQTVSVDNILFLALCFGLIFLYLLPVIISTTARTSYRAQKLKEAQGLQLATTILLFLLVLLTAVLFISFFRIMVIGVWGVILFAIIFVVVLPIVLVQKPNFDKKQQEERLD